MKEVTEVNLSRQIIAVLIAITLLINLKNVFFPIKIIYYLGRYDGFAVLLVVLGLLFFIVNAFAAYGLFRLRKWGYGAAYFAIVFSTLIYGVCYIPFFDWLFPANYAGFGTIMANIGILGLLISLQAMQFRPRIVEGRERKHKRKR